MIFVVHHTSAHKLLTSEMLPNLRILQLELDIKTHSKDGMHSRKLAESSVLLWKFDEADVSLRNIGSRSHKDSQEVRQGHHRALLPKVDPGL